MGVLGVSEDGSYVYFAANGVLAAKAPKAELVRLQYEQESAEVTATFMCGTTV